MKAASARAQKRRGQLVGPDSEEDGMGFKVDALSVVMGSLVFIAVILVAHVGGKYLS